MGGSSVHISTTGVTLNNYERSIMTNLQIYTLSLAIHRITNVSMHTLQRTIHILAHSGLGSMSIYTRLVK